MHCIPLFTTHHHWQWPRWVRHVFRILRLQKVPSSVTSSWRSTEDVCWQQVSWETPGDHYVSVIISLNALGYEFTTSLSSPCYHTRRDVAAKQDPHLLHSRLILKTIEGAPCLLAWSRSVTAWWQPYQNHLPAWPTIYELETPSQQTTQLLKGCRPRGTPANLSDAGGYSKNFQDSESWRLLRALAGSCGLNVFMALDLAVAAKSKLICELNMKSTLD